MPKYTYKCKECQNVFDGISTISTRNDPQVCEKCGGQSPRDVETELATMGNFDETCKEHERFSLSMGVNPQEIPSAMRRYPGSEYRPDGRLRIKSRKHKLYELKRRNMEEY